MRVFCSHIFSFMFPSHLLYFPNFFCCLPFVAVILLLELQGESLNQVNKEFQTKRKFTCIVGTHLPFLATVRTLFIAERRFSSRKEFSIFSPHRLVVSNTKIFLVHILSKGTMAHRAMTSIRQAECTGGERRVRL